MLNIKSWLSQAGEPVADTAFLPGNAPELPYVVFLDVVDRGGGDMVNMMCTHHLAVERYSDTADDNANLETLFNLQAIKFKRSKTYLPAPDDMFETIYDFVLIEREVIKNV